MDELDLDAIEARANAAEPFETEEYLAELPHRISYDDIDALSERDRWQAIGHVQGYVHHASPASIALIAHAREDVLGLVTEARRLRAQAACDHPAWEPTELGLSDAERIWRCTSCGFERN